MQTLLDRILWPKQRSFRGAALGLLLGFFLIILALQVFLDLRLVMQGVKDENILVLNRQVKTVSATGSSLDAAAIADLAQQPFIRDWALFGSNHFQASAFSSTLGFQTELFLQAVPSRFLDIDSTKFVWEKGRQEVPIVLSSDYLALYNFGFAPSQGLPQFTASTISLVPLQLRLRGKGKAAIHEARILGFTRNVNSILVPQSFLDYANTEYGDTSKSQSQVIVNVDNPYSQALDNFLKANDYEISRGGLIGAELKALLFILLGLLGLIAGVILALSLLVFILNYRLLIAQSEQEVRLLLHLGYRQAQIEGTLARHFMRLFLLSALIGTALVALPKYFISQVLQEQGYSQIVLWPSPLSFLVSGLLMGLCLFWYRRSMKRQIGAYV